MRKIKTLRSVYENSCNSGKNVMKKRRGHPKLFWLKSHFLFERARCFSRSRAFLVLSFPSVYYPVLLFPSFLMALVSDGTHVPGSPNGSLPDLEGPGFRSSTMEEKINEIYLQLPLFMLNAVRIENCVQTLAQTLAAQTTKIANIVKKLLGALWLASLPWKRMQRSSPVDLGRDGCASFSFTCLLFEYGFS